MRRRLTASLSSKLIALALINALALAVLASIVWLAYGRVETLSTEITRKQLSTQHWDARYRQSSPDWIRTSVAARTITRFLVKQVSFRRN